jgi:PAS domain S-box-containing protein
MTPYLFVNSAAVGFYICAALYLFCVWWVSRYERLLLLFAGHCAALSLFSIATLGIATAQTLEDCQFRLNARTSLVMLVLVTVAWMIDGVARQRARWFVWCVTGAFLTIALVNLLFVPPHGTVVAIERLELPWGELVTIPVREKPGWWIGPIYGLILAVQIYGLIAAWFIWLRDRVAGSLLALASTALIVASVAASLSDVLRWRIPYPGGIVYVFWLALVMTLVARQYRRRADSGRAHQQRFQRLLEAIRRVTGKEFFSSLAVSLTQACEVEYALVVRVDPADPNLARTVSAARRGQLLNELTYDLRNTPCENVVNKTLCYYPSGIQKKFPLDKELSEMGAESYMGVPLFSSSRKPLGLIALIHTAPIDSSEQARAFLEIVAARAGAELERETAEEALRESETFLRMSQEAGRCGSWEWDLENHRVKWSDEMCRIHDIRPEEFLGTPGETAKFVHPDDLPKLQKMTREMIQTKQFLDMEYRILRPSGEERNLWGRGKVVQDGAGRIVRVVGTSLDITERKQAELALEDARSFLQLVVDASPSMIFVKDGDGKVLFINQFAARYYGMTPEQIIARTTEEVHPASQESEQFMKDDLEVIRTGKRIDREEMNTAPDGTEHWFHTIKVPLLKADGGIAVLGIATDITERKHADQALRRAHDELEQRVAQRTAELSNEILERKRVEEQNRRLQNELAHVNRLSTLGEMGTGLAHELNQPLAAVVSYASALEHLVSSGRFEAQEVAAAGQAAAAQALRAAEIVRRWRALVRKHAPQRAWVEMNTLVNEVLTLLHNEILLSNCRLDRDLASNLPEVYADGIQIQQVLLNLARNAIEALQDVPQPQRLLKIRTCLVDGQAVQVNVTDTGPGFKPEIASQLFESFVTSKPNGLGLGLVISRSIVEARGGKLWTKTNGTSGVTCCFTLPLASGRAT